MDSLVIYAVSIFLPWLVLSFATMEIQNRISILLSWRADYLEKSILNMFKSKTLVDKFYKHPLIVEFELKDKNGEPVKDKKGEIIKPDYIPSAIFATVACEIIINAGKTNKEDIISIHAMSMRSIKRSLKSLAKKNPRLAQINQYLLPNLENTNENLELMLAEYRRNIENWFNQVMAQTSYFYKIRAQWLGFWIGLTLAIYLNIDTIQVIQKLWQEPTTRAILVAQAQAEAQKEEPTFFALAAAQEINFPVGWTTTTLETKSCRQMDVIDYQFVIHSAGECRAITSLPPLNSGWKIIIKLFGFLLTGSAAGVGAPIVYDILRKFIGLKQKAN